MRTICKHRPAGILEWAPCAECTGEENRRLRITLACLLLAAGGSVRVSRHVAEEVEGASLEEFVDPESGDIIVRLSR